MGDTHTALHVSLLDSGTRPVTESWEVGRLLWQSTGGGGGVEGGDSGEEHRHWPLEVLPLVSCVTLSRFLNLSESQQWGLQWEMEQDH